MAKASKLNLDVEALKEAYLREGSVHRVGTLFGTTGETVRAHLMRAGFRCPKHHGERLTDWSKNDLRILKLWYSSHPIGATFDLDGLAQILGRDKHNVSRKARSLGLTDIRRQRVLEKKVKVNKFATEADLRIAQSKAAKERWATRGHPRGMLGKKHKPEVIAFLKGRKPTDESRAKSSARSKAMWADPKSKFNTEEYRQMLSDRTTQRIIGGKFGHKTSHRGGFHGTNVLSGRRDDLGIFVRSSWEANYARYLNLLKEQGHVEDWKYECQTFVFEAIKRGNRTYCPDFKVIFPDGHHEWHEVKGWMNDTSRVKIARFGKFFPSEVLVVIGKDWFSKAERSGLSGIIPNWENWRGRRYVERQNGKNWKDGKQR